MTRSLKLNHWLVVADAIRDDPETYSDVMLGYVRKILSDIADGRISKSREEYTRKILEPDTWGGAIGRSRGSHWK